MTQSSLRCRSGGRAVWAPRLAFVLMGVVPLTLIGCSDTTAPEAAADPDKFGTSQEIPALTGDSALAVTAPGLGRWLAIGEPGVRLVVVDPGQSVQFFWQAVGGEALSATVSYRYGWNVQDPDDPADQGWFGSPRGGYKAQQTQPRQFWMGTNFLTIERWDGARLQVRAVYEVWVPPVAP